MTTTDNDTTTIADLVGLIDRARMALTEAGRPDLADLAHVTVTATGQIRLSFREPAAAASPDPAVQKFLTLDPIFMGAHQEARS